MKLYVVRHGMTDSNVKGLINGRNDEDLNAQGIVQAIRLQSALLNKPIDLVISSPLRRARHTANIINTTNLKIIYDDRLIERETGEYMYYPFEKLNVDRLDDLHNETIEPLNSVRERVNDFLEDVKKYQRNVLVVTHGDVARLIKEELSNKNDEPNPDNCTVQEYDL